MAVSKDLKKTVGEVTKSLKLPSGALVIAGEHLDELSLKRIPTPSTELTQALYGGIVVGRATELAGSESAGKTSLTLEIIGQEHKKAKANGTSFNVAWYETEGSWDMDHAIRLGVDPDQIVVIRQEEVVAEKGLDILVALTKSGNFDMLVINSLANMLPTAEDEADLGKAHMALLPKLLAKFSRVITGAANKNHCTLMFINQLRDSMQMYGGPTTPGGRAIKHMCTQRIMMSKVKIEANDPINAEDGLKVSCRIVKNRGANGANPFTACTYFVNYATGIDDFVTLPDVLIKNGIVRQAGAWFRIETEAGDVEEINGLVCKWQGKNNLLNELRENKEFYAIIKSRLDSILSPKNESMTDEELKLFEKQIEEEKENIE